jgi:PAS domain S-box-containing protein
MAKAEHQYELEQLRTRLAEAEETLAAIRQGDVDALVVSGPQGEQVYTLRGADYSSRILLQEMNEGAITLLCDGPILYCNRRFAEMLKLPHEKVIGFSVQRFVAPSDTEAFENLLKQGRKGQSRAEINFSAADGTVVPAYCSVNPIKLNRMACLTMVAMDLTEQKRNEEILASARLFRSVLEQASEIIIVCDESGTVIQASRAAHEICGKNLLGKRVEEALRLNTYDLGPSFTGMSVRGREVWLRSSNGKKLDLIMNASPLRDFDEKVIGSVYILTDISVRKQVERILRESETRIKDQAEALERQLIASGRLVSLGELTASMAHEFNNPLGIIMGFVEDMLSSTDPSNPNCEPLRIIDEQARRCQKIIQDLVEFARPESVTTRSTDIGNVIDKTLRLMTFRLAKQNVELTKKVPPDLPSVHADAQQLEQVLVNLGLNALDAMPAGGRLTMAAEMVEDEDSNPALAITVADTGFGIDENDLQRIFEPFFTAKKKSGLGLGLAISQRIITNHGGHIMVESQPGQGTIFRIFLPLAQNEPNYPGAVE